jgi:hypothetical protein
MTVVIRCPVEKLMDLEQKVIDRFGAAISGYNVASFADSPNKGKHHSEESLAKMRESHKKRKPISEETRQRLRDAAAERERMKKESGFRVSDETREKLAAAATGREVSEETRKKIAAANSGKPLSEEHRRKLSDAQRAREKNSEAEVAGRITAALKNKGKERSAEFKALMSSLASNRSEEDVLIVRRKPSQTYVWRANNGATGLRPLLRG